mgnify:CR=1 FL=1
MSAVLERLPMSEVVYDELFAQVVKAQKNPVHEARRQRLLRAMLDDAPNVRSEVEQKGLEKGLAPLVHQFERKLRRTLTAQDRQTLVKRIDLVGPERVGDVVLELTSEQLAAWLENADAS